MHHVQRVAERAERHVPLIAAVVPDECRELRLPVLTSILPLGKKAG